MEKLTEKCDVIRKKSFIEKYVENNTIYVVLGAKDSKADTSIGELFITMLNKIRISAGQTPKYKVPNLVLVQETPKGVEKIGNFVEWTHKVLAKKTSLKKENLEKHLCTDGISAITPFINFGNGVFINNYGPKQEFMEFEIKRHETQHNAFQKAIKAILELGSWKFSDFQLLIHAVIFSQFCEKCLCSLLKPLDSLEKAQKMVNTISHGIWCPLDRNSMERVTWKRDSGEIYEPTCWRMDRNARIQIPLEPSSSTANEVNMTKILNTIDHKAKKPQKSKKSDEKRNVEILEPEGRESDGETVGDEESGEDVDDEQDSEVVGDEKEEDSGTDGEVREEEQVADDGYEHDRNEEPQSPESMPQRKKNDRSVVRMVDNVPCPRSDQMTQFHKEDLWEAIKTAYEYLKQLELPLVREHHAHVFCVYCQSFVDDLGPKCFSHDDNEGRVKIELMGAFDWRTAERIESEDVRTMTKHLKDQGRYWRTEIENHRDSSPSPSPTPSTSPEPPKKNPEKMRMARRTGVPVVVKQREIAEEPVRIEEREEEIGTRKRKSRAFLESSDEDSSGSEEQVEGSGNESEEQVVTRLRRLRSDRLEMMERLKKIAQRGEESDGNDGVPVKKTTKKTGKSVEVAEEWGEDSPEESEQGSEESGESEGSEESEEDGIDRVAEDLRRRGITLHNARQYSPTRTPKTPQPAEPEEYDDFTEYNLAVNRKQLRKAATIGLEIRKIDKKKEKTPPTELYGSRQYFWRKAQQFEVAQLAPGPSGADIAQMDTPSGSGQETDSDEEEANRKKMKKKRKKSSESGASGGKKTKMETKK